MANDDEKEKSMKRQSKVKMNEMLGWCYKTANERRRLRRTTAKMSNGWRKQKVKIEIENVGIHKGNEKQENDVLEILLLSHFA